MEGVVAVIVAEVVDGLRSAVGRMRARCSVLANRIGTCRTLLYVVDASRVDLAGREVVGVGERLLDVVHPLLLEQGDDPVFPGGSSSSTSALISFFM